MLLYGFDLLNDSQRAEQRLWDSFYFGKKYVKPEELEKAFTQANKDMNESFQKEYPDSNDYVRTLDLNDCLGCKSEGGDAG